MASVDAGAIAEGLTLLTEVAVMVLEACDGYRAQCREHGYPEAVVDSMVADYHQGLMRVAFAGAKPTPAA